MSLRLKEFWQRLHSKRTWGHDPYDENEDTAEGPSCKRELRSVAPLPPLAGLIEYWHHVLVSDDLEGLRTADVRLPQTYPHKLAQATHQVAFGKQKALDILIKRAEDATKNQKGEPRELRVTMALVLHKPRAKPGQPAKSAKPAWPDPDRKPRDDGKPHPLIPQKLDISLWFPFELDASGAVCLPRDKADRWPRVVRSFLEPQPLGGGDHLPDPIGSLMDYQQGLDTFFAKVGPDGSLDVYVDACFALVNELLRQGSACGLPTLGDNTQWIAVPRQPGYATKGLASVYDALPQATSIGALGQLLSPDALCQVVDPQAASSKDTIDGHVAMVDKAANASEPDLERSADPLNDSQRRALHNLIGLAKAPGVIAVSGPPGTGKTAMLRAMIANQWVTAALEEREHCPVTLVCGATNQSVENVMGTFDGATAAQDPLARRWLKLSDRGGLGFTASAPSNSKQTQHEKKFTVISIGDTKEKLLELSGVGTGNDLPRIVQARDWAGHFNALFSSRETLTTSLFSDDQRRQVSEHARALDSLDDVTNAVRHLESLSRLLHSALGVAINRQSRVPDWSTLDEGELQALFPGGAWSTRWAVEQWQNLTASEGLARQMHYQKLLDVVWRPVAFHLAARYWEARWILAALEPAKETTRPRQLRSLAMLFPCMVSTLHSAPRLLTEKGAPLFDFLDLLIIDEAGQAAPELGAAVLSLAHQAVVVGDMKQLAPVSSVTQTVDTRAVRDRWGDSSDVLAQLRARGADAATGSVMKLAATGASRAELAPDGLMRDGLLLREHYRCAESIINVCIDLLYHNHDRNPDGVLVNRELVPMIPDPHPGDLADADVPELPEEQEKAFRQALKASFPLPPLAFYQTGGANDEPVKGESWSNPGEVRAIVDWMKGTGYQLARWKARAEGRPGQAVDLASLVAVVTPFRGQAEAIRAAIAKEIDEGLSKRMTIGTVHTLQGAEKPVVLFSAVNKDSRARCRTDHNHRERVFIDRDDGRLLNVAISRAQKSFILFGHSELFFSHAALNPENELPSAIVGRCLAGVREPNREEKNGARRDKPGHKLGPRRLMIVESPHKAEIIQGLLDGDPQVFGCGGHIRRLAGPGAIRWDDGLKPRWHFSDKGGSDLQGQLQRAANRLLQCDELILGTDDDAQGEAIAWHVLQVLKDAPWFSHVKRVRRVRFHALTQAELQRALAQGPVVPVTGKDLASRASSACQALNMGLAYGALALRVLDNLIGSVYQRHDMPGGGRVKGPLLRALAGYADEPGRADGRFGLEVTLLVDGKPAPARLMLGRNGGDWHPWGSDRLDSTERLRLALPQAQVGPQPCLLEQEVRALPPAQVIGTGVVLREAFARFGWRPAYTQALLQELYEQEPGKAGHESSAEPADSDAWARLGEDGRLRLSSHGQAKACKLLGEPWLKNISSLALLRELDQALEEFAQNRRAGPDDYQAFLRTWAQRFDNRASDGISLPDGPTLDEQGMEIDLFRAQPEVEPSPWHPVTQAPTLSPDAPAPADTPEPAAEEPAAAGAREGAHGALVPLYLQAEEVQEESRQRYCEAHKQLYALIDRLAMASALRDGDVQLTRRIYPLSWPDRPVKRPVEIGLEVISATPGDYLGWFDIDPEGLALRLHEWGDATIEAALANGPASLRVVVVDDALRTRSLPTTRIDHLLAWMEARGLGRPSTFANHVESLLRGRAVKVPAAAEVAL